MFLVVGLGNPGRQYEANRHNVGFMVVEEIRRAAGLPDFKEKFSGVWTRGSVAGEEVDVETRGWRGRAIEGRVELLRPRERLAQMVAGDPPAGRGVRRVERLDDDVEDAVVEGQAVGGGAGHQALAQAAPGVGPRPVVAVGVVAGAPEDAVGGERASTETLGGEVAGAQR